MNSKNQFSMPNIHKLSDVQTKNIGSGTKIWQFCVVLPNAIIGRNCNICANCFIENNVYIGNNVTIKNGTQLWDGITIEDNVFIGSDTQLVAPVTVGAGSTIAAGSTITKDVPSGGLALSRTKQTFIADWKRPTKTTK